MRTERTEGTYTNLRWCDRAGEPYLNKQNWQWRQNYSVQTADRGRRVSPQVSLGSPRPGKGRPRWNPAGTDLEMELIM